MKHYLISIILLTALCACHQNDDPEDRISQRTVIVYMAAENNLSSYAYDDLEEMKEGSRLIGEGNALIVYVDKSSNKELPWLARIKDGQVTDSKATGSEEAADQAKVRPANEIEFENILSRNPDYIFVIYEGKEKTAEKTYKEICESREFWGNMTAVRNRHVYTLPQSTFAYPPNDQWDLAYEYLYQMMFVM